MNREQYISHLRTVACGLHLDGIQKWADLIIDNIHWVKEKTLTDEEINQLWAESHEDGIAMQKGFTTQQHYFAHLILRKAQEK